jgi:ABC-type transport system involved in cytochrome c biogenesis permease subunit
MIMDMEQRKSAIPAQYRVFALTIVGLIGLLTAFLAVSMALFDRPMVVNQEKTISAFVMGALLPIAVATSLFKSSSSKRIFTNGYAAFGLLAVVLMSVGLLPSQKEGAAELLVIVIGSSAVVFIALFLIERIWLPKY